MFYWIIWTLTATFTAYALYNGQNSLWLPIMTLIWVRNALPFLDLENRFDRESYTEIAYFNSMQSMCLVMIQTLVNLSLPRWILLSQSFITACIIAIGTCNLMS